MDELLYSRVKQLREIDERLERIAKQGEGAFEYAVLLDRLNQLRRDVQDMVRAAEREHAEF